MDANTESRIMSIRAPLILAHLLVFLAAMITGCGSGTQDSKKKADSTNKFYDAVNNKNVARGDKQLSGHDAEFAVEAADAGRAELQLAQLALHNSENLEIKNFATMMLSDHLSSNRELQNIANEKKITLPAALSIEKQKLKDQFRSKSQSDFDKAFIDEVVQSGQKDIEYFQEAVGRVHYPEMTAYIKKMLPVLKRHYDAALKLQAKAK